MGYLDNIPHAMRDRKQWMLAGPDKAPRAVDFANESTYAGAKNNPDQRMTYSEARYWAEELGMYMGYVPLPDDPFTIIDLDWKEHKVYDVDAAELKQGLYEGALSHSYVEISLSGKGAHIIIEGKLPHDFNAQNAGIECYGNKGFVVITGRMVSTTNILSNQQAWLDYLVQRFPRAIDDAQFADTRLDGEQITNPSIEELALDDKFAEWIDGWHNRDRIDSWMLDNPGDDRSKVDLQVMQLFVKFTRDRKYPDESAVRMFMRCPRGKLLHRKQDPSQYLLRTLISAKARVALDDKRAKDYDFSEGSRRMLEQYQAQIAASKPADPIPESRAPIDMGAMGQRQAPAPTNADLPFTGFNWLTKTDLETLPRLDWVVKGLYPVGSVGAIYGESGAGKSFVGIDLIAAIAEGERWFGMRTKQLPVSVFALEGEGGLKGRVRAWEVVNKREYPNGVFFWDSMRNGSFALRDADARSDYNRKRLIQLCADLKANGRAGGVVVIDTLNQASDGADENSSRDMGELLKAMKFIQRETGSLVLIVHHSTKSKENQSMRGHSSLYGAMDGIMEVVKEVWTEDEQPRIIEGRRGWRAVKVKDGRDGYEKHFDMIETQVDFDEDGPINSIAIKPVEAVIVDEQTGEIHEVEHLGSLKAPKVSGSRGTGKRAAAGDRQAPPVTRSGAQNAPTWNASERANPHVDSAGNAGQVAPRSSKESAEQNARRYDIAGILDRAFAVGADRVKNANRGKWGAPADRHPTPRDELVTIITDLLNPDEIDSAFKKAVNNALAYAVSCGKLGRSTEHGKQYLWIK